MCLGPVRLLLTAFVVLGTLEADSLCTSPEVFVVPCMIFESGRLGWPGKVQQV